MPANTFIQLTTAHTLQHFEQILELQGRNQRDALTPEEQAVQGFLYCKYNVDILKMLASHEAQIIALDGEKVIGYNLCIATSLVNELPDLQEMFYAFDHTPYKGMLLSQYAYVVGGQICVDKSYRGQGLLNRMYTEMSILTNNRYQLCVTDVSQRNIPSLNAHLKTGFEIAGTYPHDGEIWNTVVWDWKEPV
jgi:hypothetical protein